MIYFEKGSIDTSFSADDLKNGLFEALKKIGNKKKVLAIPDDNVDLNSHRSFPILLASGIPIGQPNCRVFKSSPIVLRSSLARSLSHSRTGSRPESS